MYGFIVASDVFDRPVVAMTSSFKTISLTESISLDGFRAWIFKTHQDNNYKCETQDCILIAAGTVMLGRKRGNEALHLISQKLQQGKSITEIYADLRGSFSLLHIDKANRSFDVLTDRDGLFSTYQSQGNYSKIISTSQLMLATLTSSDINEVAVYEFVHGGACVGGKTLFESVVKVAKASCVSVSASGVTRKLLWKPTVASPYVADTESQIVERMDDFFKTKLDTELRGKSFCADLTAGTDSRTVFSYLSLTGNPLVASTAGPQGHVDVLAAQKLASIAKAEHYLHTVENTVDFDEDSLNDCIEHSDGAMSPFGLLKQVPYFSEKTQRFDALFGGNGGPLFKDHYWLFELNQINKKREPNWARIVKFSLTEAIVNDALFVGEYRYLEAMERDFLATSKKIEGTNNQKLDFVYFDLKNNSFAAPQFNFANRFIDVYHPMCDGHIVEYSMSIKPEIRLRARLQSELIYKNRPDLAWTLTDNYVPCVPDTGLRYPLRLTRGIRYARAAQRKVRDFVFNKRQLNADTRSLSFINSLNKTSLAETLANPKSLKIASLMNQKLLGELITRTTDGGNSGYLQRIFAVEGITRTVHEKRQQLAKLNYQWVGQTATVADAAPRARGD